MLKQRENTCLYLGEGTLHSDSLFWRQSSKAPPSPHLQVPANSLTFSQKHGGQCRRGSLHQPAVLPHRWGFNNCNPPTSQQSHGSGRKGEESYDKAYSELNRTHKGRSLWSKANYFHRVCSSAGQWHVMTAGPRKGVWFGIGSPSSVTSVQCLQFMSFISALLSGWGMTTMEGHSDAECENVKIAWLGKPWKANIHLLFKKNFDQHLSFIFFMCETWDPPSESEWELGRCVDGE